MQFIELHSIKLEVPGYGYVILDLQRDSATSCRLRDLVVEENSRGAGLGRKLLNAAVDKAITLGYDSVYLYASPSVKRGDTILQKDVLLKFYESAGFTPMFEVNGRTLMIKRLH